jgi:ribose-phosphate pyrophosphokinase
MAGGSVIKQIDALYDRGAEGKAYFSVTHPVLLPSALRLLEEDDRIEKLIVTNTIPLSPEKRQYPKVEVLSIAPMLAEIISYIHEGMSISGKLVLS